MKLLVSVSSADEAAEALGGGAEIIDAKDPGAGALGAVLPATLSAIRAAVDRSVVVSAALGDAVSGAAVESLAEEFAMSAGFVKVGFANVPRPETVAAMLARAVRGCARGNRAGGVVAVAYADASRVGAVDARVIARVSAEHGARGVLVDTADKSGAGLTALWSAQELADWVAEVHELGLVAAVAGKLTLADMAVVRESNADIVGVRGAACSGGRLGRISARRVRALRATLNDSERARHSERSEESLLSMPRGLALDREAKDSSLRSE